MEALHGDRSVEHVERLAYHAVRGELRDKAIGYLSQAGTKAFASSADAAAFAHLTQALALVETLPPGDERDRRELALRLALGPVLMARLGSAAPQLKENSARAHLLAGKVGGPLDQFQALWATWSGVRDQPRPALKIARELLAVATHSGDRALILESHHAHWSILGAVGDLTMARHHLDRGMALYDATRDRSLAFSYGGHDPGSCCRRWASWTFWTLGWPTRALEESLAAVRLAEELAHAESIALSHAWGCVFRDLQREPDAVQEHARALIAIGHQQDMPRWQLIGAMFDGWVRAQRGEGAAAVAQIHEGLDARPSQGTRGFVHYLPSLLARAYSMVGRPDEELRLIQEALVAARTTGLVVWEPEFLRLEGEMRLAMSPVDIAGAVECFREAIDIARRGHARSLELRAASSLARLLAAEGQRDEAHHALTGIYGRFTEGFDTADLRDAKILLGELS
jgi:predicted ATPase